MLIRPADIRDLEAIRAIYNEAVASSTASYALEPETLEERSAWFDSHVAQNLPVLVAEIDDKVVGWASLSYFHARAGYRHTRENSIYIDNAYRRRGIGARLLRQLIELAGANDVHAIIAGIDSEIDASIRLHSRFGFVEVGRLLEVGRKFDKWLEVVYMELLLPHT